VRKSIQTQHPGYTGKLPPRHEWSNVPVINHSLKGDECEVVEFHLKCRSLCIGNSMEQRRTNYDLKKKHKITIKKQNITLLLSTNPGV
jgi:hypothetical protein